MNERPDISGRGWRRHLHIRPGFLIALLAGLFCFRFCVMLSVGSRFEGPLPSAGELNELRVTLKRHIEQLAVEIGPRSQFSLEGLRTAERYLETTFRDLGYEPRRHEFDVDGTRVANIEVEIPGGSRANEIVIVGAHYDTVPGLPGANDNASGTATLLALAKALRGERPARTLRFVAFVNEEPPWFQSESMGSFVYARRCRTRGEDVRSMWSLETLGYYTEEKGTQKYPFKLLSLFYPSRGNYLAFVGNGASRGVLRRTVAAFRERALIASEAAVLPDFVPGAGWSDHWSFWQFDYPGVLITDTALFRYPHYHTLEDLPEHIDHDTLARVTHGLAGALRTICSPVDGGETPVAGRAVR